MCYDTPQASGTPERHVTTVFEHYSIKMLVFFKRGWRW